jgi:hypothetical protein
MNNESGSALQKANFALLILIASALAYLIVRERIRSHRVEAGSQEAADVAAVATPPATTASPEETTSSFAPLRPRVDTNAARKVVGSSIVSPRNTTVLIGQTPTQSVILTETNVRMATGEAVSHYVPGVGTSSGSIKVSLLGRVFLRGTPPPEKAIQMDALCGKVNTEPKFTRHYAVGADAGLANVFVYVKEGAAADRSKQSVMPLLDNVGCEFQPYVLGVRAGQPFKLRNSDSVLHNMHILPAPRGGNREYNIAMPVANMSVEKVLEKPEVFVKVKCDVHPWMFAYIGVVDHPWFAVTDQNGKFALPAGLPQGRYSLAAVHLKAGELVQEITISEGGAPTVAFTLDVPSTAQTNAR